MFAENLLEFDKQDGIERVGLRTKHFVDGAGLDRVLELRNPIYTPTAAYGHFGRTSEVKVPDSNGSKPVRFFPWESTDRVDDVRSAAGA